MTDATTQFTPTDITALERALNWPNPQHHSAAEVPRAALARIVDAFQSRAAAPVKYGCGHLFSAEDVCAQCYGHKAAPANVPLCPICLCIRESYGPCSNSFHRAAPTAPSAPTRAELVVEITEWLATAGARLGFAIKARDANSTTFSRFVSDDIDGTLERLNRALAQIEADKERIKKIDDAAEMLWVVLANVSGVDWTKQTEEWQAACIKWRDNYFDARKALEGK